MYILPNKYQYEVLRSACLVLRNINREAWRDGTSLSWPQREMTEKVLTLLEPYVKEYEGSEERSLKDVLLQG